LRLLAQRLADSDDPVLSRRADSRFQIEVAVCSQSARLTRAEVSLQAELSALKWLPQMAIDPQDEGRKHLALVEALEADDEATARRLAETHNAATMRQLIGLRIELTP